MDISYAVAKQAVLITPARFLFDAGQTAKEWNRKMLNDEHFKVTMYEPDASTIFSNAEIKGGVAISIRDSEKICGKIGVFTAYSQLNSVLQKVSAAETGNAKLDCEIDAFLYRKYALTEEEITFIEEHVEEME